jgi:aminopeptidase N
LPKGKPDSIHINLTWHDLGENYFGKVTVELSLKKAPSKQLFLDFRGVSICNLTINGSQVQEGEVPSFRSHKVYLPTQLLQVGEDKTNIVSKRN